MQPDLARHLTTPLALHLTGPGAQHVLLRAERELITVRQCVSPDEQAAATLTSTTADFLAWSTARLPWRSMVAISGDQTAAFEFLDVLNLM